MLWLTEHLVRALQKLRRNKRQSSHLALGRQGESEAYFFLRRLGYRMVATNFRVQRNRGEIDLVGWDKGVLCFIEVKTRTDDSFAPPSTAVTKDKQRHIRSVAKAYLRRFSREQSQCCRFDVVSVVPSRDGQAPQITLRKGAFSWNTARSREWKYRDYFEERFRPGRHRVR
jgi:putative endonuclease